MTSYPFNRRKRTSAIPPSVKGASGTEYAILCGLVSVIAIGTMYGTGVVLDNLFDTPSKAVADNITRKGANPVPGAPDGTTPEDPPGPTRPDLGECFIEDGPDSNNTFGQDSEYSCFEIAGGNDSLLVTKKGPVSVLAGAGDKQIKLYADGAQWVEANGSGNVMVDSEGELTFTSRNAAGGDVYGFMQYYNNISIEGPADTPQDWSIDLTYGDDGDGGSLIQARSPVNLFYYGGDGDDTVRLMNQITRGSSLDLGGGANRVEATCDPATPGTRDHLSVDSVGIDRIETSGCSLYYNAAVRLNQSATVPEGPFVIDLGDEPVSADIFRYAPYTSGNVSGKLKGEATFFLDTYHGRQLGPLNVDLDVASSSSYDVQVFIGPAAGGGENWRDVEGQSSDKPTTVKVSAANAPANATGTIYVDVETPTAAQTVEILGSAHRVNDASAHTLQMRFTDPTTSTNQGIPAVRMQGGTLEISLRGCWAIVAIAKPASGRSDLTWGGSCTKPSNAELQAWNAELSHYEGMALRSPSGAVYQFGFNGGAWKNGDTLAPAAIQVM